MSTANNDQKTNPPASSSVGLTIGLIIGGLVALVLLIVFGVYMYKRSRNAAGAAPSMPSPFGPNAGMPGPTGSNVNSSQLSAGNNPNAGRIN